MATSPDAHTATNNTPPAVDPSNPATTINVIFQMFGGGSSMGNFNSGMN